MAKRTFWLTVSLVNLCVVAFLGFTLRSKILFALPFIDYRNTLSAHSHTAFGGWVGLSLITLLIYDILSEPFCNKKVYRWVLIGIEISSLGMALLFPFLGYQKITILFSDLYVVAVVVFVFTFTADIIKTATHPTVKLLTISAVVSLMLSFIGTAGLAYIIVAHSTSSLLYRDSIYIFLHFQYNGFFTFSVFALLINYIIKKGVLPGRSMKLFSLFLCLSVAPALFLSLLWHNLPLFNAFGVLACIFIIASLFFFFMFIKSLDLKRLFLFRMARTFLIFSIVSFVIKMLLQVGTIYPGLGDAVYGDRPVIIGFLHLVFLGFVSFFILSNMIQSGYFMNNGKTAFFPFIVFSTGIISNEVILATQGMGILFKSNNTLYAWLLWGAAILLFWGAVLILSARLMVISTKRKPR